MDVLGEILQTYDTKPINSDSDVKSRKVDESTETQTLFLGLWTGLASAIAMGFKEQSPCSTTFQIYDSNDDDMMTCQLSVYVVSPEIPIHKIWRQVQNGSLDQLLDFLYTNSSDNSVIANYFPLNVEIKEWSQSCRNAGRSVQSWHTDNDRWRQTYLWNYANLARASMHLNYRRVRIEHFSEHSNILHQFDFPLFVINLQRRFDRKQHIEVLLRSIGFTDIRFPTTTPAHSIDINGLLSNDDITIDAVESIVKHKGQGALHSYIAIALDHISAIVNCAANRWAFCAVMEDDLMLAADPNKVIFHPFDRNFRATITNI